MNDRIFTIPAIKALVMPIAQKYKVQQIYLFGSYARGDADENSDLDFLVFGGENFKLTSIFSLAEELRDVLQKNVDVFEINEINRDSDFYQTIMKERLLVASLIATQAHVRRDRRLCHPMIDRSMSVCPARSL